WFVALVGECVGHTLGHDQEPACVDRLSFAVDREHQYAFEHEKGFERVRMTMSRRGATVRWKPAIHERQATPGRAAQRLEQHRATACFKSRAPSRWNKRERHRNLLTSIAPVAWR